VQLLRSLYARYRTFGVKQIVCEACGSKDLVKQGKILICQHCDTKYYIGGEEEKKSSNENEIQKTKISETFEKKPRKRNNFNWTALSFISFFLGWLGVDRFYVGSNFIGFIKLLIFLWFFISYIIDDKGWWFLILSVSIIWWFLDFYYIVKKGEFAGFLEEND
jgi:TM2 domain-containing membrane protein YozV/ribosomal protein L37AE/L43A